MSNTSSSSESKPEAGGEFVREEDKISPKKEERAVSLRDYIPELEPDEVEEYILSTRLEPQSLYQPNDGELISHDSQKTIHTEPTYLSFGDGGTTATVTEWGQQMQISRYLGHGESGIYAIDHAHTPEPNQYTKRRQGFLDMIDTCQGFGTDSGLPDSEWEHTTYWLRNRWPRVVFRRKNKWELTFQWVVWKSVVIHDLVWQNMTEDETISVDVWTTLEILIRELDFVNSSHSFNSETHSGYAEGPGPGGYGFVKVHRFQQNDESNDGQTVPNPESQGNNFNPDAVAAAMGVFENGNPLKKEKFSQQPKFTIEAGKIRRLVTGYKLVLLSTEKQDWKLLTLTKDDVNIDYFLCESQLKGSIPRDTFLSDRDFYIGRNLEHILSVCAIPITGASIGNDEEDERANQHSKEPVVALTCGDIAGHRICASASYFAFKFLLEVCRSLREDHPLRARIKKTCLAHLRWVFEKAKRKDLGEFARYYWVNGEIISGFLSDGLNDTPFQILKAYEYFRFVEQPMDIPKSTEEPDSVKQVELTSATKSATPGRLDEAIERSRGASSTRQEGSIEKSIPSGGANEAETKQLTAETNWDESKEPKQRDAEIQTEKADMCNFLKRNGDFAMNWVSALDKANKRDSFVWPHSTRMGMNYFRLDDHVWIWNALKAISKILQWGAGTEANPMNRKNRRRDEHQDPWLDKWSHLMRDYDPEKVKREVLQRFTIVYDGSGERMLAVTRSPRETRFGFDSRDTALFYTITDKMLQQEDERWLNLVKIQRRFTRAQDTEPDSLLRLGLEMLMTKSIDTSSNEGTEIRNRHAELKSTLITSMCTNGLFPGPMPSSEESESVSYREDHWLHVPFEIAYLLYTTRLEEGPLARDQACQGFQTSRRTNNTRGVKYARSLDGTVPFNDQIDAKNIIDLREEWLYNYPSFLDWNPSEGSHISYSLAVLCLNTYPEFAMELFKQFNWRRPLETFLDNLLKWFIKCVRERREKHEDGEESQEDNQGKDILNRACEAWIMRVDPESLDFPYQPLKQLDEKPNCLCHKMIDVEKKKLRARKASHADERNSETQEVGISWVKLKSKRTDQNAKKRFLMCQNPSEDYALMCYLALPQDEQPLLRSFFDRHAKCVTNFDDKTSRVYNNWETEFHCSFLQLGNKRGDHEKGDSEKEKEPGEDLLLHPSTQGLPDLDKRKLRRASISFRFQGDFFDRFWTCHYLESYLGETPYWDPDALLTGESDELRTGFRAADRAYGWQQRKVLEQRLFRLIISEINTSMQKIITKIEREINQHSHGQNQVRSTALSHYNSEEYFKKLNGWAALHEILEFLGDDLDTILSNAKGWNSREQDRRTEKPRWTKDDEKKYRDAINQALLGSQRAERVLSAHRATVRSLLTKLNYRREEARNEYDRVMSERNFQNNDNVKYFTYSTVIFLPLGFAASIYSMQAAPPTDVLQHMVIFSVVAFFALLVIIAILPFLLEGSSEFRGFCRNIYQDSKDLHGFWKLFYTKVPYTFSDLFTMQIPSYMLLLRGQSFNPEPSNRKEQAAEPQESFNEDTKKLLKRKIRDNLEFGKSRGEAWVQSWNRIIEPWNKSIQGGR